MIADLNKAKKADLIVELALYTEAGIEDVVSEGKVDDLVAEIERLQKEHGYPVKLDAEFIAANAGLSKVLMDGGAKEGEIVFAEQADIDAAALDAEKAKRDGILKELADLGQAISDDDAVGIPTSELEDRLAAAKKPAKPAKAAAKDAEPELVFQEHSDEGVGKGPVVTVVRVYDVILGGKTYKDVALANGETRRMSSAEFARDVKPRV